ncbi:MAG: hypothetical protein N4A63_00350 [Vallitalea sp.]|jgi:hypothetical protein|nr:hypothetical protein [Vallitalea sp.]
MNKEHEKYVKKVVTMIDCSNKYKNRIKRDLHIMLQEKSIELNESDPYILLGEPYQLAEEFAENIDAGVINQYIVKKSRFNIELKNNRSTYEYKSKRTIMGIPLVHINQKPFGVAKGFIALGTVSVGFFSLGCISVGVFSMGAISFAILFGFGGVTLSLIAGFGGVAIAGLFAVGGVAVSNFISIGGAAIAKEFAAGGYAKAKIAIGNEINAKVGFYKETGQGDFVKKIINDSTGMKDYIFNKVPNLNSFLRGVISKCIEYFH